MYLFNILGHYLLNLCHSSEVFLMECGWAGHYHLITHYTHFSTAQSFQKQNLAE